jgi:hypothetical protein
MQAVHHIGIVARAAGHDVDAALAIELLVQVDEIIGADEGIGTLPAVPGIFPASTEWAGSRPCRAMLAASSRSVQPLK